MSTPKSQWLIARVAVGALIALAIIGFCMHGFSAEVNHRIWHDIAERPGGPMTFRFALQPVMALIAAWHDSMKDARRGRTPYVQALLTGARDRGDLLREGLSSTGRILLLGIGMDAIYQWRVLDGFYPGETVVIAILLAFVPYLLLRGIITRIAEWRNKR